MQLSSLQKLQSKSLKIWLKIWKVWVFEWFIENMKQNQMEISNILKIKCLINLLKEWELCFCILKTFSTFWKQLNLTKFIKRKSHMIKLNTKTGIIAKDNICTKELLRMNESNLLFIKRNIYTAMMNHFLISLIEHF